LDRLDQYDLWDDTMVVFTTDHGHYLGEHNALGKPRVTPWQTLFHIPLIIHLPGGPEGTRSQALSSAVDLNATMSDFLGLERRRPRHGRSLLPVLRGEKASVRDTALMGYWGESFGLTDGKWKLHQAPLPENQPLYRYGVQLQTLRGHIPLREDAKLGRFIPHADDTVVLKNPSVHDLGPTPRPSLLFNIEDDEAEARDLAAERPETVREMREKLCAALAEIRAPEEHCVRLGLK
jgi:hypothetical protein